MIFFEYSHKEQDVFFNKFILDETKPYLRKGLRRFSQRSFSIFIWLYVYIPDRIDNNQ